nr:DNA replication protein [Escherichia coli]
MGSCAAPSAKGDDKFITTDYLQQCQRETRYVTKMTTINGAPD